MSLTWQNAQVTDGGGKGSHVAMGKENSSIFIFSSSMFSRGSAFK